MFHSYFERKFDTDLTFNIIHFSNIDINTSILLAPPSTPNSVKKTAALNSFKI